MKNKQTNYEQTDRQEFPLFVRIQSLESKILKHYHQQFRIKKKFSFQLEKLNFVLHIR